MSKALACAVAVGAALAANSANARLTELKLGAPEPFVEGRGFGESGAYVRLKGVARGELDPNAPEHAVIVGLDRAPRNARGMVEYEVDVFILRPAKIPTPPCCFRWDFPAQYLCHLIWSTSSSVCSRSMWQRGWILNCTA